MLLEKNINKIITFQYENLKCKLVNYNNGYN